ncbi:type II toxin-antitoxin system RelE/ParE family toxin [Furfurilactobacillus milii]|uniref:Type II toxin-antitoxin system RelE/ParE family toxin n=2 Tax=Furfurilactobacillus TaxID=2767882 RepID=A0ABT6D9M3_9LACO|nr:type II toxin-antitoxin system RelE/ParE family toxin [Furfurilactobacillus milii]QLE65529.1 hypothetical protein LROSL2_0176 [Furfurilactobacillus rossiae]MCF6161201.1 type II toxin-antitoxin system RelE/ParE family toxin [Furfurilactobacillus milii]MCF6163544.1 type II toxin-antitoxin system RelE/ParE family toxin [Furfurilactobacillus milii]MDF9913831.1 type II toxin-antitoxin system RelE/ParE family toxin [Furfurilactobacillus milii]MYV06367.1 addiction module toxin RelE [Furfurilactoba
MNNAYALFFSQYYDDDYQQIESGLAMFGYQRASINTILNKIDHTIDLLQSNPFLGPRLDKNTTIPNNYRYLVSGDYLQFYQVFPGTKTIRVYRLLNVHTDYLATLGLN